MIAIQSLWTKPMEQNNCGWNNESDLLASMELSVLLLKKHNQFEKIVFYTDAKGFELTKFLHSYYDEVIVNLDEINWVENFNWAFQKLFIYNLQTTPFVHLDFDVFLWDGLPAKWFDKNEVDYFFQGKEMLKDYPFYLQGLTEIKECVTTEILAYTPTYAVNCGVAGFNDLSIINRYYTNAKTLIENNQKHIWHTFAQRYHQCVLFEQLFLVPLIEGKKIVYLLNEQCTEITGKRYTHLLAASKRQTVNTDKLHKKLLTIKAK